MLKFIKLLASLITKKSPVKKTSVKNSGKPSANRYSDNYIIKCEWLGREWCVLYRDTDNNLHEIHFKNKKQANDWFLINTKSYSIK